MDDAQSYWLQRFRKHGTSYVARGGRRTSYNEEQAIIGAWIRDNVGDLGKLVDYGCGVGRFANVLAEKGEYVGTDIVTEAMLLNPQPTVPAPPASFDTLVCIQVLQHIENDDLIRELGDRAQRGAVIIDAHWIDNPDPHMFPRTPDYVADLLNMTVSQCDDLPQHYAAILTRDA